jgi:beta-1,4-mannosyl-glycoprotein beta-1,4-N-acetylglucosaminyltransferase
MIYDCITLFNELDILDVRLHTLADIVDRTVIVESTMTFSGADKPLYFEQNRSEFKDFPITYVVVEDMPEVADRWERERFQRNAILRGLTGVGLDDLVLICDVDEIPYPSSLQKVNGQAAWSLRNYYYTVNQVIDVFQVGATASLFRSLSTPQGLRDKRFHLPRIDNECWHFSFFGGVDQMAYKINSFSHAEYDTPEYTRREALQEAIDQDKDLFHRHYTIRRVPTNPSLPPYLLANRDKFAHWFSHV